MPILQNTKQKTVHITDSFVSDGRQKERTISKNVYVKGVSKLCKRTKLAPEGGKKGAENKKRETRGSREKLKSGWYTRHRHSER
jgi:hypothetical protein